MQLRAALCMERSDALCVWRGQTRSAVWRGPTRSAAALCMERSDAQSAAGLRACGGAHHESTQLTSDEFSSTAGLSLSRLADLLAEALLVRGCADASGLCDSEGVLCEEETVGLGEAAMAAHDLPLPFGDGIVMGDEAGRCAGVDGGLSEGRGPTDAMFVTSRRIAN